MLSTKTKWFHLGIITLLAGTLVGQAVRWSLLPGDRVTLTGGDIALLLVGAGLVIDFFVERRYRAFFSMLVTQPIWRYLALFVVWALLSLLFNAHQYSTGEIFTGFSYWGRLALLAFVTMGMSHLFTLEERARLVAYVTVFGLTAVILGFLQLWILPDFGVFAAQGWDPHVGRLLSTFFDPNYFGAYLGLLMGVSLSAALYRSTENKNWRVFLWIVFLLAWVALYFTYSRSGWLIAFLIVPLVAWRANWKLSVLIAVLFVGIIFLPGRFGDRLSQAGSYLNTNSVTQSGGDPSAAARAVSSKLAWQLAKTEIVTGVGYNTYGYAMINKGLFTEKQLAARSGMGADNSFLHILATTGLIGLILYLLFFGSMLLTFWRQRTRPEAWLLLLVGAAYTVGSFFNNILFYVPILLTWWLLMAWTYRTKDEA